MAQHQPACACSLAPASSSLNNSEARKRHQLHRVTIPQIPRADVTAAGVAVGAGAGAGAGGTRADVPPLAGPTDAGGGATSPPLTAGRAGTGWVAAFAETVAGGCDAGAAATDGGTAPSAAAVPGTRAETGAAVAAAVDGVAAVAVCPPGRPFRLPPPPRADATAAGVAAPWRAGSPEPAAAPSLPAPDAACARPPSLATASS